MVIFGIIFYLEFDKIGVMLEVSISYQFWDIVIVCKLVQEVYVAIQSYDFFIGCGEIDCLWCNFVWEYIVFDIFVQFEIEVFDDES